MTALLDAMDRLFKYYSHPEDDHHYVFKLVNMAVDVFKNNISYCSKRDISVFTEKMVYAQKKLEEFINNNESWYYAEIEKWKNNIVLTIDESKRML